MPNSTQKLTEAQRRRNRLKVGKNYPLTPREDGRWAKRIGGKTIYFGRWKDPTSPGHAPKVSPDEAKAMYDYFVVHGELPSDEIEEDEVVSVGYLVDACLAAKQRDVDSGDLTRKTYHGYKSTWSRVARILGKNKPVEELVPDDFAKLRANYSDKPVEERSPAGMVSFIRKVRVLFSWGENNHQLRPTFYGDSFRPPRKKHVRDHRRKNGKKQFTAKEIHALLGVASVPMRAAILMGVNCAYGNNDIATVPISAFDLESDIKTVEFARPKTSIYRLSVLWPETVAALQAWLAVRPKAKKPEHEELMFITTHGNPWVTDIDNAISKEFRKLIDKLDLNQKLAHEEDETVNIRKFRNFYGLRHTCRTRAKGADAEGIKIVMGHEFKGNDDTYLERSEVDLRDIQTVADRVRTWLYGADTPDEAASD